MPARETADSIQEPSRGHHLTAAEYSALVRAAKQSGSLSDGYREDGVDAHAPKDKSVIRRVKVLAPIEIFAYSLFSGVYDRDYDEPLQCRAEPYGTASQGSPLILLTNESHDIPAGQWGWARVINDYEPILVLHGPVVPAPGNPCGPAPNSWVISDQYLGFCCLSASYNGKIYVMRTPDPHSLFVKSTSEITPYNPSTNKLGKGSAKVYYRTASDGTYAPAINPATGGNSWEAVIWNMSDQTIASGTFGKVDQVLGIGLVVAPTVDSLRHWAKVTDTGWVNTKGGSAASESIEVQECEYDGTALFGGQFFVETKPHPQLDTSLFVGNVVEWAYASNGDQVIVSHIWDDPLGTVKWESVELANIRQGWRLCDDDAGAPDVRGRFIMGIDPEDGAGAEDAALAASENAIGDTGGERTQDTETPFDAVAAGTNVTNLDNADFETAEVRASDRNSIGDLDDTRPRFIVMAPIQRFE